MKQLADDILMAILQFKGDVSQDTSVDLLAEGLIDSFDIVNIVSAIEEKFQIEIEPEDILPTNFNSINNMARLLFEKYGLGSGE